MTTTHYKNVKN